jgi:hypothetical protein
MAPEVTRIHHLYIIGFLASGISVNEERENGCPLAFPLARAAATFSAMRVGREFINERMVRDVLFRSNCHECRDKRRWEFLNKLNDRMDVFAN